MNRGEIDASFFCLAKLPPPSRTVSFFGFIFLWPASIISEPRNSCQLTRSALFLYSCHSSFCYTLAAVDIIWALCSWLGYKGSVILSITSTEFAWSGLFSVVHFIPTSNSSYHFSWYPGFPLHFRFFFLNILVVASRALRQPLLLQLQKFKLDFDLASDCYSHDWLNWHWYFLYWRKTSRRLHIVCRRFSSKWLQPTKCLITKTRKSCVSIMKYCTRPRSSMSGKLIPTTRRVHLSMQCIIRAGRARMYYYFPLSYGFIHSSVHCMFIIMINAHLESWILCLIWWSRLRFFLWNCSRFLHLVKLREITIHPWQCAWTATDEVCK